MENIVNQSKGPYLSANVFFNVLKEFNLLRLSMVKI